MGYASYILPDGREAGYGIEAVCDEPSCTAQIDRGLAYLCGQMPGGDEWGCGDYFCGEHMFHSLVEDAPQTCRRCTAKLVKNEEVSA